MVGTHDAPGARPARPVEQARGAMPADVVEGAHHSVVAAEGKQHLADEVETLVVASLRYFRDVADHLPGGPQHTLAFEREEFGIDVSPCREAEIFHIGHAGSLAVGPAK